MQMQTQTQINHSNEPMSTEMMQTYGNIDVIQELKEKGYCVIPNVLSSEEVDVAKQMFFDWQKTIPNHDYIHNSVNPHGIYKFHEAGHQRHAWYIRTRPAVQNVFKKLWKTDELIASYDGSCYIPKSCRKKDKIWIHTDQAPDSKGLQCVQGIVALTDNSERTLVLYEGSHLYHETYFQERGITGKKNWQLIDHDTVHRLESRRRVLKVAAGSLVLWDSRTFHSNRYGKPDSEERIVQYICFLPRSHPKNTQAIQKKRQKYFKERRTTSHWPAPVYVNGKQPQTYGDKSKEIDYEQLLPPNLNDMLTEIEKLI